ncbi:hypothetical protein LUZ60_010789 [Juncus effusus]|nr:hypothetical protein LUZ60_010789 [Juncus effusus]
MYRIIPFFLLLLFLFLYVSFSCNIQSQICGKICGNKGNYKDDSIYRSNLQQLFSSFSTNSTITTGFSKNKTGFLQDQVYGLVLCRGDINHTICNSCINQATEDILNLCPYTKESIIWYNYCLLKYSNKDFLSSYDNSQQFIKWGTHKATTSSGVRSYYNNSLNSLLTEVSDWAAYNSTKRFGTGKISLMNYSMLVYGMSQCTPDMSGSGCRVCLQELIDTILNSFDGRVAGRILGTRCILRYSVIDFLFGDPNVTISSIPMVDTPKAKKEGRTIAVIVGAIAAMLLLGGGSILFMWMRKNRHKDNEDHQELGILAKSNESMHIWRNEESGAEFCQFSFSQIETATDNFNIDNKLGQGGFGPVYKGMMPDGLEVAVKRLSAHSGQGLLEFKNEIQLIAKLQHRNLVRLIGWCVQGDEKLLIYEFMPNKSLDFFIFDEIRRKLINWEKRFQIIEGIAQGLLYLHKHSRLRIIHRDLKTSNILLDADMTPKISDFGLARIFGANEIEANTNRVVGTYGYMAPEYASEGLFSVKSDVFSYGVMLLEIVSGKRNMGFHHHGDFLNLLGYAWEQWKERKWMDLIDPSLTEVCDKEIERSIHIALLCAQENPIDRPTMSDVMSFLGSENIILPEPKQPAYFNVRIAQRPVASSDFDGSASSINEMSITKPDGR